MSVRRERRLDARDHGYHKCGYVNIINVEKFVLNLFLQNMLIQMHIFQICRFRSFLLYNIGRKCALTLSL